MARPPKAHILELIRTHAAKNGGRPLGRTRFEDATGITEGEWLGVYWVRWNDAIEEAGLTPNSFQGAIPETELVSHLASATRQLGHFPTIPELRMLRRSEPVFPNDKVFQRLGTKAERILRVLAFCEENQGWADVAAICKPLVVSTPDATDTSDDGLLPGYVYLVRSGDKYKLGRTGELERRISELKYQSPDPVELIHSIRTDDQIGVEKYWRSRFRERRHREEWYSLRPSDVRAFKRRKGFM